MEDLDYEPNVKMCAGCNDAMVDCHNDDALCEVYCDGCAREEPANPDCCSKCEKRVGE